MSNFVLWVSCWMVPHNLSENFIFCFRCHHGTIHIFPVLLTKKYRHLFVLAYCDKIIKKCLLIQCFIIYIKDGFEEGKTFWWLVSHRGGAYLWPKGYCTQVNSLENTSLETEGQTVFGAFVLRCYSKLTQILMMEPSHFFSLVTEDDAWDFFVKV